MSGQQLPPPRAVVSPPRLLPPVRAAAGENKLPFVMGTTGGDRDKLLADVSGGALAEALLGCSCAGAWLTATASMTATEPANPLISPEFGLAKPNGNVAVNASPASQLAEPMHIVTRLPAGQGERQLRGHCTQHGQADCGVPGATAGPGCRLAVPLGLQGVL